MDAYEGDVDGEGYRQALAIARTRTCRAPLPKVFLVSTPTIKGLSRIEREFEASDQCRFFVPRPHCGYLQWLKFERLRWESGEPTTAAYHCVGFHISGLYSPVGWLAWAGIAREWEAA